MIRSSFLGMMINRGEEIFISNGYFETVGSSYEYDNTYSNPSRLFSISSTKFIAVWDNSTNVVARVFEVNLSTGVFTPLGSGTTTLFSGVVQDITVRKIDDNYFLVLTSNQVNQNADLMLCSHDGTDITLESTATIGTSVSRGHANYPLSTNMELVENDLVVLSYTNSTDSKTYVSAITFDVGTSVSAWTYHSHVEAFSALSDHHELTKSKDGKIIFTLSDDVSLDGFITIVNYTTGGVLTIPGSAFEYDNSRGDDSSTNILTENKIVVTCQGAGSDGFMRILSIDYDTSTFTELDELEFDTIKGTFNDAIIFGTPNRYIMNAWQGDANDGFIGTFDTDSDTLTLIQQLEFDEASSLWNDLIKIGDSHAVLSYAGTGTDGFFKLFSLKQTLESWFTLEALGSTFTVAASLGLSPEASMCALDDNFSAVCYFDNSNFSFNISIYSDSNTGTTSIIGVTNEPDYSSRGFTDIVFIETGKIAIIFGDLVQVFSYNTSTGVVTSETAALDLGTIGGGLVHTAGSISVIDSTHLLIAYTGSDNDGFSIILEINYEMDLLIPLQPDGTGFFKALLTSLSPYAIHPIRTKQITENVFLITSNYASTSSHALFWMVEVLTDGTLRTGSTFISSASSTKPVVIEKLTSTTAVVIKGQGNTNYHTVVRLTLDTSSLSFIVASAQFITDGYVESICRTGDNQVAVFSSDGTDINLQLLTVSSATLIGTALAITSSGSNNYAISVSYINADHLLIVYKRAGSHYARLIDWNVDGTLSVLGTETALDIVGSGTSNRYTTSETLILSTTKVVACIVGTGGISLQMLTLDLGANTITAEDFDGAGGGDLLISKAANMDGVVEVDENGDLFYVFEDEIQGIETNTSTGTLTLKDYDGASGGAFTFGPADPDSNGLFIHGSNVYALSRDGTTDDIEVKRFKTDVSLTLTELPSGILTALEFDTTVSYRPQVEVIDVNYAILKWGSSTTAIELRVLDINIDGSLSVLGSGRTATVATSGNSSILYLSGNYFLLVWYQSTNEWKIQLNKVNTSTGLITAVGDVSSLSSGSYISGWPTMAKTEEGRVIVNIRNDVMIFEYNLDNETLFKLNEVEADSNASISNSTTSDIKVISSTAAKYLYADETGRNLYTKIIKIK